jgi:class 3 adenylate cyclase
MAESRALLLIADIGGYTRYMTLHRLGLAHAQANVARLLEAVIDAAPGLELIEIEGDAAFFASRQKAGEDAAAAAGAKEASVAMHRAFHERQQRMVAGNLCSCGGCVQAGELKLKCVAHIGDVAEQTIRDRKTLAGVDVILVHRLLKNAVPVPEYVLLSEDLYRSGAVGDAREVEQELEGLGAMRAYFVDLGEEAEPLPPAQAPSLGKRLGETFGVMGRGMPYLLGLKRRQAEVHWPLRDSWLGW